MEIKIKEKKYLEKGERFFDGHIRFAFLILTHGSSFITFEEIICSAMAYLFNFKVLTYSDWSLIFNFLLFSESSSISETVFLFLKNNNFFSESSKEFIYAGGIFCLMEKSNARVEIQKLSNVLNFLKIEEKVKQELINSCLKLGNYSPFSTYLRKRKKKLLSDSKKQLKEKEFKKAKTEIERKLKIFKTQQKSEEERLKKEHREVPFIYIRNSTSFVLLILIVSKTFFDIYANKKSPTHVLTNSTPLAEIMPQSLRGGADHPQSGEVSEVKKGASCSFVGSAGKVRPGNVNIQGVGRVGAVSPGTSAEQTLLNEELNSLPTSSSSSSLEVYFDSEIQGITELSTKDLETEVFEIGEMIKKSLEKDTYICKDSNGSKLNYSYKSRFKTTGPFNVNIYTPNPEEKNYRASFFNTVMFYDDYQQDSVIFNRRIQHLVNDLKTRGI